MTKYFHFCLILPKDLKIDFSRWNSSPNCMKLHTKIRLCNGYWKRCIIPILQKYFFHWKTNTIHISIVRICMRGSLWYTLGNRTLSFFGLPTLFTDHRCFWWIHGMKTFRLYPNGWLVVLRDDHERERVFDPYLHFTWVIVIKTLNMFATI